MKVPITNKSNFSECIALFLNDSLARGQSDATANSKRLLLAQFETWCLSERVVLPAKINTEYLEGYRRYLYHYSKAQDGTHLSLSTQVQRLIAATTFLKRLYYFNVIKSNFFEYFKLPRLPRRLPMNIPDGDELEIVMSQALTGGQLMLRNRAILEVYNATGIRRCELTDLDIGVKYHLLNIRKGKGDNDRRVPLADRAIYWINRYLKELRPQHSTFESGNALFISRNGKCLNKNKVTELIGKYVRRSGVREKGSCHLFRHATATNM